MKWVQSNLWGMETKSGSFRVLPSTPGSIESMRNGNKVSRLIPPRLVSRSIESMRNGNFRLRRPRQGSAWGFNRIYEEWKHFSAMEVEIGGASSIESMRNGNDSTSRADTRDVLVQSNLWGMETLIIFSHSFAVLRSIESMRNGNLNWHAFFGFLYIVQSNLWGMETLYDLPICRENSAVQSNLWGMETRIIVNRLSQLCAVQSNLWGMETWIV